MADLKGCTTSSKKIPPAPFHKGGEKEKGFLPSVEMTHRWIPAFAGMTEGEAGMTG